MRRAFFFVWVVFIAAAVFAETKADVRDIVDHPFSIDFASGGKLHLKVRSGEVRIVGTNENRISVELSGRNVSRAHDVRVQLEEKNGLTNVHVTGGPHNELRITVRIPKETDLYARVPYGDVRIENVVGNKDVAVHAGDLTVDVGDPADYGRVEASVSTGDLDGRAFGESKDGLFRSFEKTSNGKYSLKAHVGAGDLTLE